MSEKKLYYTTSLRDFFSILFKWKKWVLSFFILIVLVVTATSLLIKPTYEASSKLLIKIGRENVYFPTTSNHNGLSVNIGVDQDEYINSEIQILKSISLAEQVIRKMEPSEVNEMLIGSSIRFFNSIPSTAHANKIEFEEAANELQNALDVARVSKSNVIQVSYKKQGLQICRQSCKHVL